jgi:hypothetical protein
LNRGGHRGLAGRSEVEEEPNASDNDRGDDHPPDQLGSGQGDPILIHQLTPRREGRFLRWHRKKVNLIEERILL